MRERGAERKRNKISPREIERAGRREPKKLIKPRVDRESGAQREKEAD